MFLYCMMVACDIAAINVSVPERYWPEVRLVSKSVLNVNIQGTQRWNKTNLFTGKLCIGIVYIFKSVR